VLRFIAGLGLGGELPVGTTYINEFAKAGRRGWFVLIYQSVFPVGNMMAALVGAWVVPHLGWRAMFIIGALPAGLIVLFRRMLPESPRWLASRGRLAEADRALRRIEDAVSGGGKRELPPPLPVPAVVVARASWRDLFGALYRRRTFAVWLLTFCSQFIAVGVTLWLPGIYKAVFKLPDQDALLLSSCTYVAQVLGVLTCSAMVDRAGRRKWLSAIYTLAAVPLLLIFVLSKGITVPEMLVLAVVAGYFLAQLQLGMSLYPSELYPTRIRALGSGIAGIWGRMGAVVGPPVIGLVLQRAGLGGVFLMLAAAALVGAGTMWFFGTETRCRLLEELSP
jgi:MFS transporter, putative metabolite:H+ symporter